VKTIMLGALRLLCQQRADRESDDSIVTSEWNALISEQVGEMASVVADAGFAYWQSEATINLTTFALPTDHMATWGVDYVDGSGRRRPLTELQPADRSRFIGQTGEAYYFLVVGQVVELYPTPSSGTYKIVYLPQPADLSAASDSVPVDLVCADGQAFVIWGVAVKARSKSTDSVAVMQQEREAARARLFKWAVQRSFATPRHAEPAENVGDWRRRP
jgi:hypothetical protein